MAPLSQFGRTRVRRATKLAVCCVMAFSLVALTAVPANAQLQELLNLLIPPPTPAPPPAEPAPAPVAPAPGAPAPGVPAPAAAPPPPVNPRTQPFPIALPQIRRSPARNTNVLIERLQPAVARGVPLEAALLTVRGTLPDRRPGQFQPRLGLPPLYARPAPARGYRRVCRLRHPDHFVRSRQGPA